MRTVALLAVVSSLTVAIPRTLGTQGQSLPNQPPAESSSYDLIDRALEAKRIDEETAHKYRVFAAFADSRLPAEFQGTNTAPEPPPEVEAVGLLLATFSEQTQAELMPFFVRPDEPGSWITLGTVGGQAPETRPPGGGRGLTSGSSLALVAPASFAFRTAARRANSAAASLSPLNQTGWRSFPAAGGKAKVWAQDRYPDDAAKAEGLAQALTSHIWNKLNDLMDPEPVSDANLRPNGGDGALDFYLVRAPLVYRARQGRRVQEWQGLIRASLNLAIGQPPDRWLPGAPCPRQRYILLDNRLPLGSPTSPGLLTVATHELMHAITIAYRAIEEGGCGANWISEASGAWAENFVYPDTQDEHRYLPDFLDSPHFPVDTVVEQHHYGAYLLPLFAEKSGAGAGFMPAIWDQFRTRKSLEGINAKLSGGWDKAWPQFLITNWNRPPVDRPNGYRQWDRVAKHAYGKHDTVDTQAGPRTITIDFPVTAGWRGNIVRGIPSLAGWYRAFKFQPSVRSVFFENTVAELAHPGKSVWGIAKIRGTWEDPKDWTSEFSKSWCRDDRKEDIEELIIIFGNSDWQTRNVLNPPKDPTLKAYPTGCTAWTGTTRATNTITSTDPNVTIVETATSTMRFEIDSAFILPGQPRENWKVVSGNVSWSVTVTGGCTGNAQGNFAITDRGPGDEIATLKVWDDGGTLRYMGTQGPTPGDIPTYVVTCPGKQPATATMTVIILNGWWVTDGVNDKVSVDGKSISGRHSQQLAGAAITTTHQYSFRIAP